MGRQAGLISMLLLAIGLAGCAGKTQLAVQGPLERISAWPAGALASKVPELLVKRDVDGLTIVGTRGAALNVATKLHRQLMVLKIQNEISCELDSRPGLARTRLLVSFPGGLTSDQQHQLADVLARFRSRG